ncbi:uncharacterized protein N0V89_003296 [Didymosphaeria variabile]|uniref:Uncharacterized protein n=1 Tax=Didymosphaeria variabile TaxID=1932322 RepID=A0A9W8XWF7_9PLEO|nr:uncharacterized protein N0V89_003296 [Didymosphaeria variabile]KAJ4358712.1 hypothetical protein N0V89_003296 [Didymosphaeria variabile]
MTNPQQEKSYKDFVKRVYRDLKPNMEFPDKTYVPGDLSANLITTYGFDNWFLSFERRLSRSSPAACISAVGNREVELISHAWEYMLKQVPQQRMDKETYNASRYLHVSTKMLKRDLESWESTGGPGSVAEVMSGLSNVRRDIELFDPDLRDAYQIFVNNTTLLDARKGIQMAEKSIEMSEKSIKESERVRISECFMRE